MRPPVVHFCLAALLGSCTESQPDPSVPATPSAPAEVAPPRKPVVDDQHLESEVPVAEPGIRAEADLSPRPPPSCEVPATEEGLAQARAYWKEADPSVSQFDHAISTLPPEPAMRSALARVLLPTRELLEEDAEGHIGWCRTVWEGVFDTEPMELEAVQPTEVISASGCARRALMLQMLEFLNACDLQASELNVKLMMSSDLHEPDHTAAFALIEQAEHLGQAEWVLGFVFENGPQTLQKLAIERLVELGTVEAKEVLRVASGRGLCGIAYEAAQARRRLGSPDEMPNPEKATTPQEAFFELCMLAATEEDDAEIQPRWEPLIDAKGYQMTVDCRDWSKEDAEAHGHCDALTHRRRNPPPHAWGPTVSCEEPKGKVVCNSNPINDNSGVASRVEPTWFTFAQRQGKWALVDVMVRPKVTDAWVY